MTANSGQLRFFELVDIDRILAELNVSLEDVEVGGCVICGRRLKKNDIGAFRSDNVGGVEPICKEFSCIMNALLEERNAMRKRWHKKNYREKGMRRNENKNS